jgi:uncharacterized protein YabE (DUF348 family)
LHGNASEIDWFAAGYPPGFAAAATAVAERPVTSTEHPSGQWRSVPPAWPGRMPVMDAYASAFTVTTEEVLEVLGPDADDLLATAQLDVDQIISMINAETMLLPRIDEELEAMFAAESAVEPRVVEPEPLRLYLRPEPEEAQPQLAPAPATTTRWKRRFLKATIAAILLSATGGGAMALAMDKDVTVDVDGHETHIRTYAGTVGDVLRSQGITPGAHDALSPSPSAPVTDGGTISVEHGRLLRLVVDGVEQDHWTRAQTVADALGRLGVNANGAFVSAHGDNQIPLSGLAVEIRMPKAVNLIDGANAPRNITTTDATVGDLLRQQGITLGAADSVDPGMGLKVTAGMQIMVSRNGAKIITVTQSIPPPVQTVNDANMNNGDQNVDNPGAPGSQIVTYRVNMHNGKESSRDQLSVQITLQPQPKIVRVGTKPLPDEVVWDKIAQCESGGNWSDNTGNGYYGGLQFNYSTWLSNGGGVYAQRADLATKQQQIAIADRVRAGRGYEPWQCAQILGIH